VSTENRKILPTNELLFFAHFCQPNYESEES